jgi:hypothetical protein
MLGLLGGALPLCGLLVLLTSIGTGCPKCGKWWAKVDAGTQVRERKKCYGLVTRYAHSSSSGYVSGTSGHQGAWVSGSGTTRWQERVPVIRTTCELHYRCRYCHHCWWKEKVEVVEDFDIDRG